MRAIRSRLGLLLCYLVGAIFSLRAGTFVPTSDDFVLERLPGGIGDATTRELRQKRLELGRQPQNLSLAVDLARRYLERWRTDSDPRYLGYARSALAPWWNLTNCPVQPLVMRAIIRQSTHDFAGALADLNLVIKIEPGNAQAWLTRTTVLQVRGDFTEARRSCATLFRLASPVVAVGATASLASLTGSAAQSSALLRETILKNPDTGPGEKIWAWTVLAEIEARLGRDMEAETDFQHALALGRRDGYLLGSCADFLLDQGRADETARLLQDETRVDGLLLRLTLAEKMQGSRRNQRMFQAHVQDLHARFEASRMRGDTVHRREEARFQLELMAAPGEALRLALENWQVQREPADARILLESALAAGEMAAARPVLDWIKENRLEDSRLALLQPRFGTINR